jgi:hypothetical protein
MEEGQNCTLNSREEGMVGSKLERVAKSILGIPDIGMVEDLADVEMVACVVGVAIVCMVPAALAYG